MSSQSNLMDQKARDVVIEHLDSIMDESKAFKPQTARLCAKNGIHVLQGRMLGIDGQIGVGKSRLGKELSEAIGPTASFIKEYVSQMWLDLFYPDQKKRAGVFQINQLGACVTSTNVMIERCKHGSVGIIDRTPMGNLPFAFLHKREGNIDDRLFACYKQRLIEAGPYLYADIIYLAVSPETAKTRIENRSKRDSIRESEEEGVSLDYLRRLDEMMLFVALYMRATGNARVSFWNWTEFGEQQPRQILSYLLQKPLHKQPARDKELLKRLKRADYETLKNITRQLYENVVV